MTLLSKPVGAFPTLFTFPVKIVNPQSKVSLVKTNAILDTGSNVTLITKRLATMLRLKGKSYNLNLAGIGANNQMDSSIVDIRVLSPTGSYSRLWRNVYVVDTIAGDFKATDWSTYMSISECKPVFSPFSEGTIDLLIGVDQPTAHRTLETKLKSDTSPLIMRTPLGWSCAGYVRSRDQDCALAHLATTIKPVLVTAKDFHSPAASALQKYPTGEVNKTMQISAIREKTPKQTLQAIEELMIRHWTHDSLSPDKNTLSVDENYALKLLSESYKVEDGRATVSPLWKQGQPSGFVNNFGYCKARLDGILKKMTDINFETIDKIFESYLEQGIAREVFVEDPYSEHALYWPHFAVPQPQSETTPVRPVMDGKAKCVNGKSINDHCFIQGPNIMNGIVPVLLKFRHRPIAFTGDISKMFLKIKLPECDCKFHRFLWVQKNDRSKLRFLEFTGHLFGNIGSPTCAMWTTHKNATDRADIYPKAANTMKTSSIVDDVLDSTESVDEAVEIIEGIIAINESIGLPMAKFASNSRELVKRLPNVSFSTSMLEFIKYVTPEGQIGEDLDQPTMRTLGQYWRMDTDRFTYKSYTKEEETIWTKLKCLSQAHKIFDPLGFASPFLTEARLFLQSLWSKDYGWDDPLKPEDLARWKLWLNDIDRLNELWFDRILRPGLASKHKSVTLHVFTDASKDAFAAVGYVRVEYMDGSVSTNFAMCKFRINPVKPPRSIPRLELMGIFLGCEMAVFMYEPLEITEENTYIWTDSKTCIQWLHMESRTLCTQVHNYCEKIHDLISISRLRFVPGEQNPADLPTRPRTIDEVLENPIWKTGPAFLSLQEDKWPQFPPDTLKKVKADSDPDVLSEIKKEFKMFSLNTVGIREKLEDGYKDSEIGPNGSIIKDFLLPKYYPNYGTQMRVFANVFCYARKLLLRARKRSAGLIPPVLLRLSPKNAKIRALEFNPTKEDMLEAETRLVWHDQHIYFPKTIAYIVKEDRVPSSSKLWRLGPIYAEHSGISFSKNDYRFRVLRLSGRLKAATHMSKEFQEPLVLPPDSELTKSMILHTHKKVLQHVGGVNCVLCELRKTKWVVSTINQVKHTLRSCVKCRLLRPRPMGQQMAPLPNHRVPSDQEPRLAPFHTVALDCAGHWNVKSSTYPRRPSEKRYMLIFRCCMYGAVHIEKLDHMNTVSFLYALKRFIAARGLPRLIISDNGTNFKAGNEEIVFLWTQVDIKEIEKFNHHSPGRMVEWSFNPPDAHHYSGLIERMVGVSKVSLKAIMPNPVTDEELETVFKETEQLLNNRPIGFKHSPDPNCLEAITPAHFLGHGDVHENLAPVGPGRKTIPERFTMQQNLMDQFWSRFVLEMAPQLRTYNKWVSKLTEPKIGDVVAVLNDETAMKKQLSEPEKARSWRKRFNLARIIEIKRNTRDGLIHNVILKYRGREVVRSIHNLYMISDNSADLSLKELEDERIKYSFPSRKEIRELRTAKGLGPELPKFKSPAPDQGDLRRSARLADKRAKRPRASLAVRLCRS